MTNSVQDDFVDTEVPETQEQVQETKELEDSKVEESESEAVVESVKKCEIFLIRTESGGTVRSFKDWEEQKKSDSSSSKNVRFWSDVDKACSGGKKVYVSKPNGVFSYSSRHQGREWKVVE